MPHDYYNWVGLAKMNIDKLVLVDFYNTEREVPVSAPGYLREGSNHFLLVQGVVEKADLYTYTVIPKRLIDKITELRVVEQ